MKSILMAILIYLVLLASVYYLRLDSSNLGAYKD